MARGGEITQDERHLLARLDQAFAHQRNLDPAVLASVRAWQKTDRTYELVQNLVRNRQSPIRDTSLVRMARVVRHDLEIAIESGRLPFELRVFRGLRDIMDGLGVAHPSQALGRRIDLSGFCATTVLRKVATDEFTAQHGVLLDLLLPAGAPALWVAGVGDPALRHQGELLLDDARVHVYSHVHSRGATPVLQGEVVLDEQVQ